MLIVINIKVKLKMERNTAKVFLKAFEVNINMKEIGKIINDTVKAF